MKCPKCGYLGFDAVDRCRNCGYEFSLVEAGDLPELQIRTSAAPLDPLADLAMVDAASAAPPPVPRTPARPSELPLFRLSLAEEPESAEAAAPRPAVHVRRRWGQPQAEPVEVVEIVRRRLHTPRPQADLDLDSPVTADEAIASAPHFASERDLFADRSIAPAVTQRAVEENDSTVDAGLGARLLAVLIDLAILAAVDAAVVYFTLQICGIPLDDVDVLPKAPLLAFLIVQNGGYLVAFTAGGQTLGKMIAGIRVVSDGSPFPLDLGRAALRTFIWVLLAIPAGLGFLTAVFNSDRRGLHDRFAQTRVVRASA